MKILNKKYRAMLGLLLAVRWETKRKKNRFAGQTDFGLLPIDVVLFSFMGYDHSLQFENVEK